MNCADYLVDYLIKKDVTDVFGFSGGGGILFLLLMHCTKGKMKLILISVTTSKDAPLRQMAMLG